MARACQNLGKESPIRLNKVHHLEEERKETIEMDCCRSY